jgi:hypothetical protein
VTVAPEQLRAEVEESVRADRAATIEELGWKPVLWLAAPPLWAEVIARAVQFPAPDLPRFIKRARDAGWCKVRGAAGSADRLFWIPDEMRRDVIDTIRDRVGSRVLEEEAIRVANLVASACSRLPEDDVPGALRSWAELLTQAGSDLTQVPPALVDRVSQAINQRDLAGAQDLVAAGEALAPVVAGPAVQALSRARRLLALGRQRRQDERALRRYMDRPELSDAIDRLLKPKSRRLGLHLRGAGGVGKTMLIRWVASGRYAQDRGRGSPLAIARADFDHISPDYPVRRPVQLLLELADELALHTAANERADRALTAFRSRTARAHEAVSGPREAGVPPLQHPEVARAVDSFGDVLVELGDVLLILDTCEELAKAYMGDPAAPAVRATFDIIERLQSRAKSARILFAGRRPLPERRWLEVQPVASFTVDEARKYLSEFAGRRPIAGKLADAMIRQSPATDETGRVSPFDLALYASWANEDPDIDTAVIDRGSDAYIEGRIIERLGDSLVVRALPVLASAGRCRVATIAGFLNLDPATLGRQLAAQEWIDADGHPPAHVAARPALASRLRRYFEADERREEFAAQNARLGSALLARVRDLPLADIDADELIATLHLSTPEDAATLWDSIADQAMEPPDRWDNVLNMTRSVLGQWEEEEWPTTPALRATVTAAHIAASRRDSPLYDARGHWQTVRDSAGQHPDPEKQRTLRSRAESGLIDSFSFEETITVSSDHAVVDTSLIDAVQRTLEALPILGSTRAELELRESIGIAGTFTVPSDYAVVVTSAIDAVHRLLEDGQIPDPDPYGLNRRMLQELGHGVSLRAEAWAKVALARILADRDPSAARGFLDRAERGALAATGPEPSWPDWILPDDLLARIRIEYGLIAPPDDLSVLDEWESYAASVLQTIDGERLASLCLRIRLRHGVLDTSVAEHWEALDSYKLDRTPTCTAHNLVPPLCVSIAEAWLSAGEPERALALLDRRRREALGTRRDDTTVRHVDRATVEIARRLRLTEEQALLSRLTEDPSAREDAWRAKAVIYLEPAGLPTIMRIAYFQSTWHAWWQSQVTSDATPLEPEWTLEAPQLHGADITADLEEMRQLNHPEFPSWEERLTRSLSQYAESILPVRSAEPHREMRAAMRMAALANQVVAPPPAVPKRLLAEMLFEEAELTALRLPEVANRLFSQAAVLYEEAGDPIGKLLALLSMDSPMTAEAQAQVRALHPTLATKLSGPPEEAGPWRYWAETTQRPIGRLAPRAGPGPSPEQPPVPAAGQWAGATQRPIGHLAADPEPGSSPEQPPWDLPAGRARRNRGTVVIAVIGALIACGVAIAWATSSSSHSAATTVAAVNPAWVLLVALVALAGVLIPRIRKIRRLAAKRGLGATRLGNLRFDASINYTRIVSETGDMSLRVDARPWRTAPPRAKAVVWLLSPLARLAAQFRRGDQGYRGKIARPRDPEGPISVSGIYDTYVSSDWWLRGKDSALGIIRTPTDTLHLPHPWERIFGAALSPYAAGRIEWIRLVSRPLGYSSSSAKHQLLAPASWDSVLRQHYSTPHGDDNILGVCHVLGRSVATSAGPVMDIGGTSGGQPSSSTTGGDQLPGVRELTAGQPGIVILQAEPATDEIGADPPDDQAEKLTLGMELADSGVPAVLLLPILPAGLTEEISRTITRHVTLTRGQDAQRLLTKLRKLITPHVPPQVLDDIVLFLNEGRYR